MNSKPHIILVTGASSGIGESIAKVLVSKGYSVFGTSRKATTGSLVNGFTMIQMDVNNESSVKSGIEWLVSKTGKIDAVINNAGLGMLGPIESISDEEAKDIFQTNVFGVLNVCRNVIPHMRQQQFGYVINITSIAGMMGLPYRGIYSSSKFAVEGITESMSQELQQFGIRVCLIEPGDFRTSINQNRKVVKHLDPVYAVQCDEAQRRVNEEVLASPTPEYMGYLVHRILQKNKPRLRYRAANVFQRFSLTLKRVLPSRWFESLVMNHYGMKKI